MYAVRILFQTAIIFALKTLSFVRLLAIFCTAFTASCISFTLAKALTSSSLSMPSAAIAPLATV